MNEDIKILVVKYITGQANRQEIQTVKRWIKEHPENEAYYVGLYETWQNSLYSNENLIDPEKAYRTFKIKTYRNQLLIKVQYFAKFSAAAAVVLACLYGFYRYSTPVKKEGFVVVNVPKGNTRKLVLSDGSFVWINAGSQLKYDHNFGKTNRTVYLSGEAFFDIAKNKEKLQFLVKTSKFTIKDVGTVFNVKAYADEQIFETAVIEGKVSVEGKLAESSPDQSKVFLDARQVLKINLKNNVGRSAVENKSLSEHKALEPVKVVQITASEISEYNGWKDNLLVFDEDSFEDITKILERRYNVKLDIVSRELKDFRYTGTFRNVKDVYTILNVIRETTPITYSTNDNTITIHAKN